MYGKPLKDLLVQEWKFVSVQITLFANLCFQVSNCETIKLSIKPETRLKGLDIGKGLCPEKTSWKYDCNLPGLQE